MFWIPGCGIWGGVNSAVLQEIHDTIAHVLKARFLDWRTCFTHVRAEPPEGRRVVIECSDRGVLGEIRRRLSGHEWMEGVTLDFVELPVGNGAFAEVVIAATSVADIRRSPSHAVELVTQVVCGDAVAPLKQEGDWVLVRLDDSYIGWVRSWHLKGLSRREYDEFDAKARHRVRDNMIQILETPEDSALPVSDAVVGTRVVVESCPRRGWRRVTLPDGRQGSARARGFEERLSSSRISRENLAVTGLRFIGIPYVWGGTTPKGFDCSGLTQRIFRLHGMLIPRDSDLQAGFGRAKIAGTIDGLCTGDLLFFGKSPAQITHVGMYLSNGLFLHAHGQVRVNALFPAHPLFEERLVSDWQLTRDPLIK